MSGGHFDYACFHISQFADELQHEIDKNDNTSIDKYGGRRGAGYSPTTMEKIKAAQQIIDTAGRLAREIEWLYSDDHGEETFCELFDKIIGGSS